MATGLVGPLSREFGFSDGPTYSDMYWLLSHGSSDPVVLYLAGRAMAALLLVFGFGCRRGCCRMLPLRGWPPQLSQPRSDHMRGQALLHRPRRQSW